MTSKSDNMFKILVLISLISVCSAQVFSRGSCPNVQVKADFNVTQYLGSWYEIYKFPAWFENDQKCVTANYTLLPNGHIRVDNKGISKTEGTVEEAIADAYIPDEKVPAKILVKFPSAPIAADYWVLDTDYTNYTLIYSCLNIFGIEKIEFGWILSRKSTLDSATSTKLQSILKGYKVDTDKLIFQDQSCK